MSFPFISKAECIRATAELDFDVDLYAALAVKLGQPPTPSLLAFMGAEGRMLAERRALHAKDWCAFRAIVSQRHPQWRHWTDVTAEDGTRFDSVAELLTYRWLRGFLPASVKIQAHANIHPCRKYTADFLLISDARFLHVEVLGMLSSDCIAINEQQAGYLIRLAAKLEHYSTHGYQPVVIHGDELIDPERLDRVAEQILKRLAGAAA
jgi:hypothetical protein